MAHELAAVCVCKRCGERLTGPTALIVGSGLSVDNQRVAQFSLRLAEHIIRNHPEENKALEYKALEFLGMLRLMNYTTADRGILEQRDYLRWRTHQATLKTIIPDAKLEQSAKDFAATMVDMCVASLILLKPGEQPPAHVELATRNLKASVAALLREILGELRKLLQEPGAWDETAVSTPKMGDPTTH